MQTNVGDYKSIRIKLGIGFEIINYIIQENKQFCSNYICIGNIRYKFTFSSVASYFIDNTIESEFANNKFKSIDNINLLRRNGENNYNENNEMTGIDANTLQLYKQAIERKKGSIVGRPNASTVCITCVFHYFHIYFCIDCFV